MVMKIWDKPLITLVARQLFMLPSHIKWDVPQAAYGGGPSGEALSEFAGRLCYLSFGEGEVDGHASVKGRTVTDEYFANILDTRHGSVLEHAVWSILFEGVSRSFTHELVRHRAGFGFSQLSQRFVDESDVGFVIPPLIMMLDDYQSHPGFQRWKSANSDAVVVYKDMVAGLEKDIHPLAFGGGTMRKKRIREAARSVLPNDAETKILVTGNARAWRNFIEQRGNPTADMEMVRAAEATLNIVSTEAPAIFQDACWNVETEGYVSVTLDHSKV